MIKLNDQNYNLLTMFRSSINRTFIHRKLNRKTNLNEVFEEKIHFYGAFDLLNNIKLS